MLHFAAISGDIGLPEGSDGLTRAEVWKLLDTYQTQWKERFDRHATALDRNTQAMTDGFNSIRLAMEDHAAEDRAVALRVHDIEEREKVATTTLSKRNLMASGALAAVVGPAMAALFRWFTGAPK